PGRPTVATWPSCPTVRGTASCGLSTWKPVASGRCCNRAALGYPRGLRGSRRPRPPPDLGERSTMKCLHLLVVAGLAATAVVACGGPKPVTTPTPTANADSAAAADRARQDSMAREQQRQDSIRAAQEAERAAAQRRADSAAAASSAGNEVKAMLAALIHFDYDKSNI